MFHLSFTCVLMVVPFMVATDPISIKSDAGPQELAEHGLLRKFDDFTLEFGKTYGSLDEYNKRFAIFKENLKRIDILNREERGTAKYGITKFVDLTYNEFLRNFTGGRISQAALKRHAEVMETEPELEIEFVERSSKRALNNGEIAEADIHTVGGKVFLPKKFDYRKKKAVTPVKDQGGCGSCWAFSTIANIEGVWAKSKKKLLQLSEQELLDCDKVNHGCGGGMGRDAVGALVRLGGVAKSSDYPYEATESQCRFNASMAAVKVAGVKAIPTDEKKIARALIKHGPLSAAVHASDHFMFYKSGVFDPSSRQCKTDEASQNHEVTIVAYGETSKNKKKLPFWVIKNSWGKIWGEKGYMRIVRGKNACAIKYYVSSVYL